MDISPKKWLRKNSIGLKTNPISALFILSSSELVKQNKMMVTIKIIVHFNKK